MYCILNQYENVFDIVQKAMYYPSSTWNNHLYLKKNQNFNFKLFKQLAEHDVKIIAKKFHY